MASGEVIKSFLASLGFAVDEEGLKRFTGTIAAVSKKAAVMGATLTTAALAVEAAVRKVAEQFEDLYYASVRSGSTAANLRVLGYAAEQIGINTGEAQAAVTGLYHALILNPGTQGLLQQLGVQVRDLDTSKIGDTSKLLVRLVEKLKEFGAPGSTGFAIAAQYAQAFGITADQLILLERQLPELKQQMADYARRLQEAGIDSDDLSKRSHGLMVALRRFWSEVEVITDQAVKPMIPAMTSTFNWAEKNAEAFAKWSKAMHDVPSTIAGIGTAVAGALGLSSLLKLIGIGPGAKGIIGTVISPLKLLGRVSPYGAAAGLMTFFHSTPLNEGEDAQVKKYLEEHRAGGGKVPLGLRSSNPLNLMPGGNEAIYGSAYEGYVAGAKNLIAYGRRGWDTLNQIVQHWAPKAGGNNERAYVSDLSRRLGVGANAHLNLYDPETLRRLMAAMTIHENGYNPYSAQLIGNASRYALGGTPYRARPGSVTLNQKTDIHVSGGNNPAAVGRSVASEQGRVNSDAIRNLSNSVQ